jgi:hypothetical protein
MSSEKMGGPAFPHGNPEQGGHSGNMTMWDYYAARTPDKFMRLRPTLEAPAACAEFADAMIAQRAKRMEGGGMSGMPKKIYAYHREYGTGTWIDFDDSSPGDPATEYIRADLAAERERALRGLLFKILVSGSFYPNALDIDVHDANGFTDGLDMAEAIKSALARTEQHTARDGGQGD